MKAFGYSYLLDMYQTKEGVADDLELHYRFLENLVDKLGMTPMSTAYAIHGPRRNGKELFPEKAGCSGWQALVESGIQIHSIEPTHFITLDVYSCKPYDPQIVFDYAKECFGFEDYEHHFLARGTKYEQHTGN